MASTAIIRNHNSIIRPHEKSQANLQRNLSDQSSALEEERWTAQVQACLAGAEQPGVCVEAGQAERAGLGGVHRFAAELRLSGARRACVYASRHRGGA